MKKILKYIGSTVLTLLFLTPEINAKQLSPDDARQNVSHYLNGLKSRKVKNISTASVNQTLVLAETVTDSNSVPLFYIFSKGAGNGFVIASADDRLIPVLGHSDKGNFGSYEDLPEVLKSLFNGYQTSIPRLLADNGESSGNVVDIKKRNAIEPMVELWWGQDYPLNTKCPIVYGERAPVGCVGLGMAMVMAYHKYPDSGQGSITYTNPYDKNVLTYDFDKVSFDYDNMLEYYLGDEDDEQIEAVADLCVAAGMSVKSEYRESGTGADLSATVFNTYFKYPSEGLALLSRSYFTPEEWEDLVYDELANGRPVLYRGGGKVGSGGHAFVIDGYEEETGLFHINWGWYGDAEGYYNLSILRPAESGTGSNSDDVYSIDQQIVRGLRTPYDEVPTPIFTADGVSFDLQTQEYRFDKLYCRGGQNVVYPGLEAKNVNTGEKIYIESLDKDPLTIFDNSTTGINRLSISFKPDFSNVPDGEYILRPVARLTDDKVMNPGNYLEFYPVYCTLVNDRYITAVIKDGKVAEGKGGSDVIHDIKFTNFSVATTLITGSNRAFTMDGVNNGNNIIQAVRVWVYKHGTDELAWQSGERSDLVLEPGNSGTFNLAIPNMTNMGGTFDLEVTNNEDPTIIYSDRIPFELVNSSTGVVKDGFKYVVISEKEKTAAAIRTNTTYSGEIVFPEKVEINGGEYTLIELSNAILMSNTKVTKVTLPPTIRRIAGSSFSGCSALEEINLPESLEYLGGGCFMNCKSLTSIIIPPNITSIGDKTFSAAGLTSVTLPEGLESIGKYGFYGCKISRVVLPASLKSLGEYAFDNSIISEVICGAAVPPAAEEHSFYTQTYRNASIFVPKESIEDYKRAPGWYNFKNYNQINEDKYVKVDDLWYELTQNFEAYVIPARNGESYTFTKTSIPATIKHLGLDYKVTEIKDSTFMNLSQLTTCTGGANLKKIGSHAFENAPLASTPLTNTVEEIGDYAFFNTNLGTIVRFPTNLKSIGNYAFSGNKRMNFYKGFNEENWLAFPTSLKTVGDGAFAGCEALNLLGIGSDIQFGENVFDGCVALEYIYLDNRSVSVETVRKLAESLESTYFYINGVDRDYFTAAFEGAVRLYDLLTVKSISWDDAPEIKGITKVTITFDSPLGNPAVSSFIMKDNMFRDIGSANIDSTEDYASNATITIALAPTVLTQQGHLQINFVQSGLTATMEFKITEIANLIQTITLSETSKTLKPKEKFTLSATFAPEDVENKDLVWTSSNPKVAIVESDGNVTAVGVGSATVTCKALMGLASAKCTVNVEAAQRPGKALDEDDPNADITIADVVAIVSHITGNTPVNFNADNADVNRDGKITVSDVTSTVKIILNQEDSIEEGEAEEALVRVRSISEASEDNFLNFGEIIFENSNLLVNFASLEAKEDFTALQADIICPANIAISNIELDNLSSHTLSWKKLNNGNYRVVVYSLSNVLLPVSPTRVLKLTLKKVGKPSGAMSLTNGWVSTPDAQKVNLYATGGMVEIPTGIGDIYSDFPEAIADVFTVEGVLIKRNVEIVNLKSELAPGIYILRGSNNTAKVVVN